jgi:hypothetical protein
MDASEDITSELIKRALNYGQRLHTGVIQQLGGIAATRLNEQFAYLQCRQGAVGKFCIRLLEHVILTYSKNKIYAGMEGGYG